MKCEQTAREGNAKLPKLRSTAWSEAIKPRIIFPANKIFPSPQMWIHKIINIFYTFINIIILFLLHNKKHALPSLLQYIVIESRNYFHYRERITVSTINL